MFWPKFKPVCEAYLKHVVQYNKPARPLLCERPFNPEAKNFSRPEWKLVNDISEAYKYGEAINEYITSKSHYTTEQIKYKLRHKNMRTKKSLREGLSKIEIGYFDFNNDGVNDRVLRNRRAQMKCSINRDYSRGDGSRYYLLNQDDTLHKVVREITQGVYDLFYFQGHTYLDAWFGDPTTKRGALVVFNPAAVNDKYRTSVMPVCKILYFPNTKEN